MDEAKSTGKEMGTRWAALAAPPKVPSTPDGGAGYGTSVNVGNSRYCPKCSVQLSIRVDLSYRIDVSVG